MPVSARPERPDSPEHQRWLAAERSRLWVFATASADPRGGFAWLDASGRPVTGRPVETWITARMTHVAALECLSGNVDAPRLLDHGVAALTGTLHDRVHDGWFAAASGTGPPASDKRAYEHAFVLLAASSAVAAGHPESGALLARAQAVFETRFWREDDGLVVDVWDRAWVNLEPYRGLNANMHTVEALLAVYDVTAEPTWLQRAQRIVQRVVHGFARAGGWRLPEHFTPSWAAVPDYNHDEPAHPFRPFGVTVGHLLEWSRLTLHLGVALGPAAPGWLLADAESLFLTAVREGWSVDGAEGFVYTIDFDGRPVVRDRLHWVLAEGIAAAYTLWVTTGKGAYGERYAQWWDHAERLFIDREHGSWRHELDCHNRPAATVWSGKPDIYHAYQAALLPALGQVTSFAGALARRRG